jgi:hypothetical protein
MKTILALTCGLMCALASAELRSLAEGNNQPTATQTPPPRTTLSDPAVRFSIPDKPYVVLRRGPVRAMIADNRAVDDAVLPGHRAGYHGVASLTHERQPRNLFVPAYAGLNFEHIHDGTVQAREILFEPREAPMQLRAINDHVAELFQPATPFWGLESCLRYELLDDGVIEVTFECVPRKRSWRNNYLGLFWASYIHQPESLDVHFPGAEPGGGVRWIRGVTPEHGVRATHRLPNDHREFAHDAAFPLSLVFNFSDHRVAEPWFFGQCRGMAFAQVFRRDDKVRISQSPSGGGTGNPAWDFQWFIPEPEVGRRYQLIMRALYRPLPKDGAQPAVGEELERQVKAMGFLEAHP